VSAIFHHYAAGYVQDDWKVSRRLTLNLGVRWASGDGDAGAIWSVDDLRFSGTIADQCGGSGRSWDGASTVCCDSSSRTKRSGRRTRTGLLRAVGLAWQLNNRTVLRAGYALFYLPVSVEVSRFGWIQLHDQQCPAGSASPAGAAEQIHFHQGFRRSSDGHRAVSRCSGRA
jgi:hypothetical protein